MKDTSPLGVGMDQEEEYADHDRHAHEFVDTLEASFGYGHADEQTIIVRGDYLVERDWSPRARLYDVVLKPAGLRSEIENHGLLTYHIHGIAGLEKRVWDRIALEMRAKGQEQASPYLYDDAELRDVFEESAAAWRRDSYIVSSLTAMVMHPGYQRIIGLGRQAIPLILKEMKERPDHWFWALRAITGEDPAKGMEKVDGAAEAWLEWGRNRGYLS